MATQNSVDYGTQVTGTRPPANADSTSTVISNGLVTTGSLVVVQGGTVAAGVTGNTSGDTAVRFFAGSTLLNRDSAPFRVTQSGALVATNATLSGSLSIGKPNFSSTTTGIFLGFDGAVPKLNIGDANNNLR